MGDDGAAGDRLSISVITPWLNARELIPRYEQSTLGAQVILVDNGSTPDDASALAAFAARVGGIYIRNEVNVGFSRANNQGLARASGDIILFLNNDVQCQATFLDAVRRDVKPWALYGHRC